MCPSCMYTVHCSSTWSSRVYWRACRFINCHGQPCKTTATLQKNKSNSGTSVHELNQCLNAMRYEINNSGTVFIIRPPQKYHDTRISSRDNSSSVSPATQGLPFSLKTGSDSGDCSAENCQHSVATRPTHKSRSVTEVALQTKVEVYLFFTRTVQTWILHTGNDSPLTAFK